MIRDEGLLFDIVRGLRREGCFFMRKVSKKYYDHIPNKSDYRY